MVSPDEPTTVERILDQQGRSIRWLAIKVGVDPSYAWRMLHGERPLTPEFRSSTAEALGVPEDIAFPAAEGAV